jgi:hypothetical protein
MTVVPFRSAQLRAELRIEAKALVEAIGSRAGLLVGRMALLPDLAEGERGQLRALADEIDQVQGFGWFLDAGESTTIVPFRPRAVPPADAEPQAEPQLSAATR